ncbi:hypothetical protein Hsw_3927 [Hymenobacter swuensis DY53]|uniref:Uncharacterized protein n=1 Tax=Hymenobacter swuensis DY53 TaxID=1227739 RepID=W8F676_9BACT|nr:hypothetical protein Hsw_3927 [Hymenobacter swuensis DY53]
MPGPAAASRRAGCRVGHLANSVITSACDNRPDGLPLPDRPQT